MGHFAEPARASRCIAVALNNASFVLHLAIFAENYPDDHLSHTVRVELRMHVCVFFKPWQKTPQVAMPVCYCWTSASLPFPSSSCISDVSSAVELLRAPLSRISRAEGWSTFQIPSPSPLHLKSPCSRARMADTWSAVGLWG